MQRKRPSRATIPNVCATSSSIAAANRRTDIAIDVSCPQCRIQFKTLSALKTHCHSKQCNTVVIRQLWEEVDKTWERCFSNSVDSRPSGSTHIQKAADTGSRGKAMVQWCDVATPAGYRSLVDEPRTVCGIAGTKLPLPGNGSTPQSQDRTAQSKMLPDKSGLNDDLGRKVCRDALASKIAIPEKESTLSSLPLPQSAINVPHIQDSLLPDPVSTPYWRLYNGCQELLLIMFFLGATDISQDILKRACMPQYEWAADGCVQRKASPYSGEVFGSIHALQVVLSRLKEHHLVNSTAEDVESLSPHAQSHLEGIMIDRPFWKAVALKVMFYIFPQNTMVEPFL